MKALFLHFFLTSRRLCAVGATALALTLALTAPAWAGRSCEHRPPDVNTLRQGLEMAERTRAVLDASNAYVVILARAGQDLSRYGLRYSHLGLAYKDQGIWRVLHKLNTCGSAEADVYRQGLAEFFSDDPFELRAGVVVLSPAVQVALHAVLKDNQLASALHTQAYNMLAYPWSLKYQQSNQWALEVLAAAVGMEENPLAATRERAQAWLQFKGYQPTVLRLGTLTRLGARVGTANIAFDDHPNEKRFNDRIETVTVDSVFDWLTRSGLGTSVLTVQ
jgi:hypothetical protein